MLSPGWKIIITGSVGIPLISTFLPLWTAGVLTAALVNSLTATAADGPAKPDDTQAPLEEIVVTATGTSIRGIAPVGANLVTFGREDIIASGAETVSDVMTGVPQLGLFNLSQNPGVPGAMDAISAPSLRGLGSQATLSLVNGHRMVAAGILSNSFDPNVIPAAALQRVEIVPDGSSAIYGSDAVAGVVNFITRQNFSGAETSVRYGQGSSYHDVDFSQLFGKAWSTGSVMLAYEYTWNSPVLAFDRPNNYQPLDRRPQGGNDTRSTNCPLANVTLAGSAVNYAAPGFVPNTTNFCDATGPSDLLWSRNRNSVFLSGHQEITDSISVWSDASYSSRNSDGRQTQLNATAVIPNTNPFFQPIPASNATSETVNFRAANLGGRDYSLASADASSTNITVGFDFKLPANWAGTAHGTYGSSKTTAHEPISLNTALLNAQSARATPSTALDPFGTRTNPTVAAGITDWNYYNHATQTFAEGDVKGDWPLFTLPRCEVQMAVGASLRRQPFHPDFHQGPADTPPPFHTPTHTPTL